MNIATSPTTKEILISKGLGSFINGSYHEASKTFEEILGNSPNDADALHHLAGCQIQMHQNEAALASIEKALNINPKNPLAWFRLGQIHYTCKRYESAVDAFGKAIEIKPEFSDAWFMGGQALIQNGNINDGMLALKNALTLNPTSLIFNEIYARAIQEHKKNVATIVVFGGIEEIIFCLPFLLANKDQGLKFNIHTNFKLAEKLFESLSIPINQTSYYSYESEKTEQEKKVLAMREHYQCPRLLA